jgi:hypothetical protein
LSSTEIITDTGTNRLGLTYSASRLKNKFDVLDLGPHIAAITFFKELTIRNNISCLFMHSIITYLTYSAQYNLMTTESDSNRSKEPKNRGEVYRQEQQRIAEESHQASSEKPREPKNRGEVYRQEQQRIAEESHQAET